MNTKINVNFKEHLKLINMLAMLVGASLFVFLFMKFPPYFESLNPKAIAGYVAFLMFPTAFFIAIYNILYSSLIEVRASQLNLRRFLISPLLLLAGSLLTCTLILDKGLPRFLKMASVFYTYSLFFTIPFVILTVIITTIRKYSKGMLREIIYLTSLGLYLILNAFASYVLAIGSFLIIFDTGCW